MEQLFAGKSVLVTGAGWGIGAAAALIYAANGARVIVSDIGGTGGRNIAAKISSQHGTAIYIKTDVSDAVACENLVRKMIVTYGSIDIACNNSVLFSDPLHPVARNGETFDNEASLNLNGLQNCMKYEIEAMLHQEGGIIINTSSIVCAAGLALSEQYVETKYGMSPLLQNTTWGYPDKGVTINTIAPAYIAKEMLKAAIQPEQERGVKLASGGWPFRVQEIASLILWLSSDEIHLLPTDPKDKN